MRIVISGYIGKNITGIGRNLLCLLENSSGDHEYIIYTNHDMEKEFHFTNPHVTVKTYPISKMDSWKNLLWTTFVFPFVVYKEHADKALIPNFTLLLFKFKPTIVIMHDLIEFNVADKFSKKKMFYRTKFADPVTAKRANDIITVSENSKRDIMKYLGIKEEKITVIYNGVDQTKFKKMEVGKAVKIIHEKKWPENFLLYAGTLDHPGKNVMAVIQAFEHLKDKNEYQGYLILAGMPGAGYEIIKRYVENSRYRSQITLPGFVTDEELIALYSMCDVFCFVSLYEGFGIPPLEALSCGARVIVSNTSSLPEVVGDAGIMVDPNDIDTLASSIKRVIDGEWNMTDEYVKHHLQQYDWNHLSRKFEMVLCKS